MHRLQKLQRENTALQEEMTGILDAAEKENDGELDEKQAEEYAAHEDRYNANLVKIDREQRLLDRQKYLDTTVSDINAPTAREVSDREGRKQPDRFESLGENLMAIVAYEQTNGMNYDPRLRIGAATGMSEGLPSDGGFLVQTDLAAGLEKKMHDTGQVWNRCRNIPISSNSNGVKINAINETSRVAGSRWGGIRGYWLNEAGTKTASAPKFRQMELNLKKLIGLCYATDELLQDATALETVLSEGFAEEFGFLLDDAVINGTGAGQPLGILAAGCVVSVAKETGQAATTVVAENIEKMYSRLWARSLSNAVWFINQDVWPQLFQLSHAVGTGGVSMFVPAGGISGGPAGTLLGRPIVPIEQCATLGTVGDIILADCSQYVTATKGGAQSASSIHVKFVTDETVFRWVYRTDGQPLWNAALTPYKGTNTQSPFITLATRS